MLLHFPILEFHPFSMNKPRGKEMLAVKSCKGWVRKPQRSVCRSHLVTFNQLELPRWEGNLQDGVGKWEPLISMRWNRKLWEWELWEFCFYLRWERGRHRESKNVSDRTATKGHICIWGSCEIGIINALMLMATEVVGCRWHVQRRCRGCSGVTTSKPGSI